MSVVDTIFAAAFGNRPSGDVYWHYFQAWRCMNPDGSVAGAPWGLLPLGTRDGAQYVNSAQAAQIRQLRRAALTGLSDGGPGRAAGFGLQPVADQEWIYDGGRWNLVSTWERVPWPDGSGNASTNVVGL